MLEDDTHYGEKILRAFVKCCTGRGRPASIEASVFLLTSEDAGHHMTSSCFLLFTLLNNYRVIYSKFFHIFKNIPYIERYLFIHMSRQLALPEPKRYLLHCVQPYRTPKTVRERNEIESGTRRAAVLKQHATSRESKAARGRAAIQNISKRRETRRSPKGAICTGIPAVQRGAVSQKRHEDVPQSNIYQSGNELPQSKIFESGTRTYRTPKAVQEWTAFGKG